MPAVKTFCILVAAFSPAARAASADPPAAAPSPLSTTVQSVTVTAQRRGAASQRETQERIDAFSDAAKDGRIASWSDPICPLVRGLSDASSRFIEDRIKLNAESVDAPSGGKRCEYNIVIFFTNKADQLAAKLVESERFLFLGEGVESLPKLKEFIHSTDVVREFKSTRFISSDGGERLGSLGPSVFIESSTSRLFANIDIVFSRIVVIVDASKIGSRTPEQIADYLSLLCLGDVRTQRSKLDIETIANLFTEDDNADTLTIWDRNYLKALYAAGSGARTRSTQIIRMTSYLRQH